MDTVSKSVSERKKVREFYSFVKRNNKNTNL